MKKTYTLISCLAALAGLAQADVTIHDVTFTNFSNGPCATNDTALYQTTGNNYIGGAARSYIGFYVANDTGLKFNHDANSTVKYLYLGSAIEFSTSTGGASTNKINWSTSSTNLSIVLTGNGWLDIDAVYLTRINVASMSGGTVYLNDGGQLGGSILSTANTLVANAVTRTADVNKSVCTVQELETGFGIVTRTLLKGNYSDTDWEGKVTLDFGEGASAFTATQLNAPLDVNALTSANLGNYWVTATAEGVTVTYVTLVPEPATATLSLLALAGLAARRRRK